MKNKFKVLAKSVLLPLGLRAAASPISSDQTDNIMKTIKSLEEPGPLKKGFRETIKNEKRANWWISRHVIRYIRCYFAWKSINS